jgi:hypothetical protein
VLQQRTPIIVEADMLSLLRIENNEKIGAKSCKVVGKTLREISVSNSDLPLRFEPAYI